MSINIVILNSYIILDTKGERLQPLASEISSSQGMLTESGVGLLYEILNGCRTKVNNLRSVRIPFIAGEIQGHIRAK